MKTPYHVATKPDPMALSRAVVIVVVDRRRPEEWVCQCADLNMAVKIAAALNLQHQDGATRRAALPRA